MFRLQITDYNYHPGNLTVVRCPLSVDRRSLTVVRCLLSVVRYLLNIQRRPRLKPFNLLLVVSVLHFDAFTRIVGVMKR